METVLRIILIVIDFIWDKSKDKSKLAELIGRWIIKMRSKFSESAAISKAFDSMWKEAESKDWKETT